MKLKSKEIKLIKSLGEFHDNLIRPFSVLLRNYEDRDRAIDNNGNYKFVASLGQEIALNLLKIRKLFKYEPSFIDIGCGIGNITAIAKFLDFKASGIEINSFYSEIGNPYNKIENINIFDLNYLDKSVIFLYRPIHDMDKLFLHLKKICVKNTIIYSFGSIPNIGKSMLNNPFIVKI